MTETAYLNDDLFAAGPPMHLQQRIGLLKPGKLHVVRRSIIIVLVTWVPLALLVALEYFLYPNHPAKSFFSDVALHTRYLIAAPALILAEADCLPRLGHIARHFMDAGLIVSADTARYEAILTSTRRLLDSTGADVIIGIVAYVFALGVIFYVSPSQFPAWYRASHGTSVLSMAGWWHALVSLPLLLMVFFGWLWRIILWARFLTLMTRLDLRLIPSHPDLAGGIGFVSTSLRRFRLLSLAFGSVVAGSVANRVIRYGASPLGFKNLAIGLSIFCLICFAGPLTVFVNNLREARRRGIVQYGALASQVGAEFEAKWLKRNRNDEQMQPLAATDFSATTDLYSVVANAYQMRGLPFGWTDLISPIGIGLLPFAPVALLAVPMDVVINSLVKLLL